MNEKDMEIIYGSEEYEDLQRYFEHRKNYYFNNDNRFTNRLRNEYVQDTLEELRNIYEEDKVSDRQRAIRRILAILEEDT
jgi:hypothetical protein